MGSSWLSGLTQRRRIDRQREGAKVDGRRVAYAFQTMIKDEQFGVGQTLADN